MEVDITTNILSYTMCEVGTNKKWIGMCVQEVMQPFVYQLKILYENILISHTFVAMV